MNLSYKYCLCVAGVNGFGSEQVTFEIVIVGRSKSLKTPSRNLYWVLFIVRLLS